MKKKYALLSLAFSLLVLLSACGGSNEFVLEGTLGTQKGEKILVVYDDPIAKVDTILPAEGKFEYIFIPDTITLLRLVNDEGIQIPIFADKGWKVTCEGTFAEPKMNGDGDNEDYESFLKSIKGLEENNDTVQVIAEKFIRSHPQSFASAYLIDKYFIQSIRPDVEKVKSLIIPLNGEVKDSRILNVAMKSLPTEKKTESENMNYFSLKGRDGNYISWNTKKGQYILINFWATWDAKSTQLREELKTVVDKLPKNKLKVFNISLDYDKEQWTKACKPDTDNWIEICSFEGWETTISKQNNINYLPTNILINGQRNIKARDIYGESLIKLLNKQKK